MKKKKQVNNNKLVKKAINAIDFTEMKVELFKAGMTPDKISDMLLELCNWKNLKIDKNGNIHEFIDGKLRLNAIELWCKITGSIAPSRSEKKSMHASVDMNKLSDEELDSLLCGNK